MDPATVDCSYVLHVAAMISPDACAAARATIRAAEIQAKAARHAGTLSLLAGLSAIIAGATAYVATGRQLKFEKDQVAARAAAYSAWLREVLSELSTTLFIHKVPVELIRKELDAGKDRVMTFKPFRPADEFRPEHWENHALLGKNAVRLCANVHERWGVLVDITTKDSGKNAGSAEGSHAMVTFYEDDNGNPTDSRTDTLIETWAEALDAAGEAIDDLGKELDRVEGRSRISKRQVRPT